MNFLKKIKSDLRYLIGSCDGQSRDGAVIMLCTWTSIMVIIISKYQPQELPLCIPFVILNLWWWIKASFNTLKWRNLHNTLCPLCEGRTKIDHLSPATGSCYEKDCPCCYGKGRINYIKWKSIYIT